VAIWRVLQSSKASRSTDHLSSSTDQRAIWLWVSCGKAWAIRILFNPKALHCVGSQADSRVPREHQVTIYHHDPSLGSPECRFSAQSGDSSRYDLEESERFFTAQERRSQKKPHSFCDFGNQESYSSDSVWTAPLLGSHGALSLFKASSFEDWTSEGRGHQREKGSRPATCVSQRIFERLRDLTNVLRWNWVPEMGVVPIRFKTEACFDFESVREGTRGSTTLTS
jgi:hypothetical protein